MIRRNGQPLRGWQMALLLLAVLALLAVLIYQLPPVKERLGWRIDFALTYIRGVLNPVEALPTAVLETPQISPTLAATYTPTQPPATPTAAPELSPTPTPSPTPLPASAILGALTFEKQDINNCGPATLALHLRMFGWEGDQFTISNEIKQIRADRNVNVEELVYYVRNFTGWLNIEYRVGGSIDTLRSLLAAGLPVMIEEGFPIQESYWPNDDRWAGHYLLVTGYDDNSQSFVVQDSFEGPDRWIGYRELKGTWQQFNYVYIVLFYPDQSELVKSILGADWDPDVNRQNALELSRQETLSEAGNAYAWFNLGTNQVYFERYKKAAMSYDKAREIGLPQRMLRYQFGPFIAYFHSLRTDDLLALTTYALERTPNSEEALLWQGWGLFRKNDREGALESFQQALEARPGYDDALYAINYVQSN